jgi:two-component system response regulator HydG
VASNERLWDASRKGKFREDLFHRFNEFSINVPPLRERKEDIEIFAAHFLQITNEELGKNVKGFSKEVMDIFKNYVWYGNLREMKNVVKRATLLTDGEYIEVISLPFEISNHYKLNPLGHTSDSENEDPAETTADPMGMTASTAPRVKIPTSLNLKSASIDAEFETIMEALKKVNFNKSKAAQLLNIDRKTLYNKMKEYQLINNQQHEQ